MLSALMDAVEARTNYANPANWFKDYFLGGEESTSGIRVSGPTALTYAAVYRAVNLISDYVGKIPLVLYKRTSGNEKEPDKNHPAYRLLRFKPHPVITAFPFRKTLQSHALLHGSGYAWIARDGAARPLDMTPLDPVVTYPEIVNGRLWYVTIVENKPYKILPENIFHLRGLPKNGIECYSVIGRASESIGLGLAARKYGAKFFKNNGFSKLALEHPGRLSSEARKGIRDSWMEIHSGLENAHKPIVLEEAMKIHAFTMNMEDAQFLETRQFEIREIANWFGLPPHKLGDTTRTAFASLEQENQSLLDDCLDPWFCAWEEECRDKLLTEAEKEADSHVVEFKRQALIRANMVDRSNSYRVAVGGPWMAANEVRALENMPAIDGGDELVKPLNSQNPGGNPDVTGKGPPKEPTGQPKRQDLLAAARGVVVDAARRAYRRLAVHAKRAAEKPQAFLGWLEALEQEHLRSIAEIFGPGIASARTLADISMTTEELCQSFVDVVRDALLDLSGKHQADTLAAGVAECMARFEAEGPEKIADELIQQVVTYTAAAEGA